MTFGLLCCLIGAWTELKIGGGDNPVPLERVRLRNYDTLKVTRH
jgi:hypothetical protein